VAAAASILCPSHKLCKKYLPPWLRPQQQQQQQQQQSTAAAASTPPPLPQPVYRSRARLLLLGIGADEQLAGYGRHRSSYAKGGMEALERELAFDLGRLWTRYRSLFVVLSGVPLCVSLLLFCVCFGS